MVNHKCTLPQKIELSATSVKLHEASSQAICNGYYYYNNSHYAERICQMLVSSVLPVSWNHCHIWWQKPKGLWCSMNTVHAFLAALAAVYLPLWVSDRQQRDKMTKRRKEEKDKRPRREFSIVMSGQFRTLVNLSWKGLKWICEIYSYKNFTFVK